MPDKWDKTLAVTTPGAAFWPVYWQVSKHPFFSVFTDKAIQGMVQAMVDALPVKDDDND